MESAESAKSPFKELAKNFTTDSLIRTPIISGRAFIEKVWSGLRRRKSVGETFVKAAKAGEIFKVGNAGTDVLFGILKEIGRSGRSYPKRFLHEVREMATTNPRLTQIRVPVLLIHGGKDSGGKRIKIQNFVTSSCKFW